MTYPSRLSQLKAAHTQLVEFSKYPSINNLEKAALIKAFEFTFELCWKTLKFVAEQRGLQAASPKDALRAGLALGFLENEVVWLQMQKDRNTTAHTYSADYAQDLVSRVKSDYAREILKLIHLLQQASEFANG